MTMGCSQYRVRDCGGGKTVVQNMSVGSEPRVLGGGIARPPRSLERSKRRLIPLESQIVPTEPGREYPAFA